MSEFVVNPTSEFETAQIAAIIENELRGGFLQDIALAKVNALPENATPREVAEVILPEPKGSEPLEARWILIDKALAQKNTKAAIATSGERIMSTAETLELRKIVNGERQAEDINSIDPERARFLAESGANKTSVVRRGVAIKCMRELYGENLSSVTLYQLGGERIIPLTREENGPDGAKEVVPNKEHETIRTLAGDHLPANRPFTEFDANVATALAEGYKIETTHNAANDETTSFKYELVHPDTSYPRLVIIQPAVSSLEGGFDALKAVLEGRQLVGATNGQYRKKYTYQSELWAKKNGVEMMPTVVLGDEPGDRIPFGEGEIVVPNRPEAAYINELIVLYRLAMKSLPNVN